MELSTLKTNLKNGYPHANLELALFYLNSNPSRFDKYIKLSLKQPDPQAWEFMYSFLGKNNLKETLTKLTSPYFNTNGFAEYFIASKIFTSAIDDIESYLTFIRKSLLLGCEQAILEKEVLQQDFEINELEKPTSIINKINELNNISTNITAVKPYFKKNYFSHQWARYFNQLLEYNLQPSLIIDPITNKPKSHNYRKAMMNQLLPHQLSILGFLTELKLNTFRINSNIIGEQINFIKYNIGDEFKDHYDAIPHNTTENINNQRYRTILMGTSENYMGGETEFKKLKLKFTLGIGDILVFDNIDNYGHIIKESVHSGNVITKGTKTIMSKWLTLQPTDYQNQVEKLMKY